MKLTKVKIYLKSLQNFGDKRISLGGWIRTNRKSKNFGFIELNDGSCFGNIQVVYDENTDMSDENKFGIGAAVIIDGILKLTPNNKQPFEIVAQKITLEGECESDYPMQKKTSLNGISAF